MWAFGYAIYKFLFSPSPDVIKKNETPAQVQQQPIDPAYKEYMTIGYQLTNEKDYDNALLNFEKALAIVPNDSYALKAIQNVKGFISEKKYYEYMNLGYSLVNKKDSLGAIENFNKALNFKPNDPKALEAIANVRYSQYTYLGERFIENKDYKAAFVTFEMALKNKPNDSKALENFKKSAKLTAFNLLNTDVTSGTSNNQNSNNKVQVGLYLDLVTQIEREQKFEDSLLVISKAFQENPSEQNVKVAFQKTAKQLAASYIRK